ncbi:kappaPI-actitoxin-Avd3a-like [Sitophilus oryzae]|uniref:KappaPI-actitoxin-Avd3a-like n=1 Tax=Sitophilus oryzae TaxID=7048 RepID=A0A6J2Y7A6_SITOR|nr:kappaPI-actitoxin-Avd3a-like [Sitophilus oryzae]
MLFKLLFVVFCALIYSSMQQNTPHGSFSKSDCDLPHTEPGPQCKARIPRFWWNNTSKACQGVIYGGCRATKNNFETLEQCIAIAGLTCTS